MLRVAIRRAAYTLWSGLITLWIALTLVVAGDELETRLFPVISDQTVSGEHWSGPDFCWSWTFYKRRTASVESFTWHVRAVDSDDIIFLSAQTESGRPLQSSKSTPGGHWRTMPLCITPPPAVAPGTPLTVEGEISHRTFTPWRVNTRIRRVTWPVSQ